MHTRGADVDRWGAGSPSAGEVWKARGEVQGGAAEVKDSGLCTWGMERAGTRARKEEGIGKVGTFHVGPGDGMTAFPWAGCQARLSQIRLSSHRADVV